MQTLRRHNPTHVADDQWPATAPVDLDTASGCACLRRICDAERQISEALDAARASIAHCERALELVAGARRLATVGHIQSQPNQPECRNAYPDRLTTREAEVLHLIAAGHSNRKIAEALFISPRTIERHIANIYLKIDVHSKGEATAYALRHDMP